MPTSAKNIILVGLPCCGKTTLGRLTAEKLLMHFIDLDEEVIKRNPPQKDDSILSMTRRVPYIESGIIGELKNETRPTIVSTGADTVTDHTKTERLRNFGHIIYIKRDRELLLEQVKERFPWVSVSTNSKGESETEDASGFIFRQYEEATVYFYEDAADTVFVNNGTIEEGVSGLAALIQNIRLG